MENMTISGESIDYRTEVIGLVDRSYNGLRSDKAWIGFVRVLSRTGQF